MIYSPEAQVPERPPLRWLIAAAVITIVLWQVPWGNYILYPFSILATWFHEMGHGLTAILLGGRFEQLLLFADGSGLAFHRGSVWLGPLGRALVAAGGPLGPAIAGALLILLSRGLQTMRMGLWGLGIALAVSTLLWVRSLFGWVVIPLFAMGILGVALKAPRWLQSLTIQFLGVQACVSTFHQVDYLFTHSAVIGGRQMLSDSAQIAEQLVLPYWFWGGLLALISLALLAQSLRLTYLSGDRRVV